MRKILAFAVVLLYAGIARAEESEFQSGKYLLQAALDARHCSYDTKWTPIYKEDWKKPEDGESVLEKIVKGNKNYLKAINSLHGSLEQISDDRRELNAAIPVEIRYPRNGWRTIVNLRELEVFLEQKLYGNMWLPTSFVLTVKYWKGVLGLGLTFHERYQVVDLKCDAQ